MIPSWLDFNKYLEGDDIFVMVLIYVVQFIAIIINTMAARITKGLWRLGFLVTNAFVVLYFIAYTVRLFVDVEPARWSSFMLGVSIVVWIAGPWTVPAAIVIIESRRIKKFVRKRNSES